MNTPGLGHRFESRFPDSDLINIEWEDPIWFWQPNWSPVWSPTLYEHHVLSFALNEDGSIKRVLMGYARNYGEGLSWSTLVLEREGT